MLIVIKPRVLGQVTEGNRNLVIQAQLVGLLLLPHQIILQLVHHSLQVDRNRHAQLVGLQPTSRLQSTSAAGGITATAPPNNFAALQPTSRSQSTSAAGGITAAAPPNIFAASQPTSRSQSTSAAGGITAAAPPNNFAAPASQSTSAGNKKKNTTSTKVQRMEKSKKQKSSSIQKNLAECFKLQIMIHL